MPDMIHKRVSLLARTDVGRIAVLRMQSPPVNALNAELRRHLAWALDEAVADPAIDAVVLSSLESAFSLGLDMKEVDRGAHLQSPSVFDLTQQLDRSPKPVVAAMQGMVLGAGLELALACHYRVFHEEALVGMPDIRLGLAPGAGGLYRLPRALGMELAVELLLSGEPISAEDIAGRDGQALLDRLASEEHSSEDVACQLAQAVGGIRPLPRLIDLPLDDSSAPEFLRYVAGDLQERDKADSARPQILSIMARQLHLEVAEALRLEHQVHADQSQGPLAKALRYAFFAERAAVRRTLATGHSRPQRPQKLAIVGAGPMGQFLVRSMTKAGIAVHWMDPLRPALDQGLAALSLHWRHQVSRGRLSEDRVQQRRSLITMSHSPLDLVGLPWVLDAMGECSPDRESVWRQWGDILDEATVLVSTDAADDLQHLAQCFGRPGQVMGLHWLPLALGRKLLEIVHGPDVPATHLAAAMELARAMRRTPVLVNAAPGWAGPRLLKAGLREAYGLVRDGASPWQVDRAMESFGMAMGPFRMMDHLGTDWGGARSLPSSSDRPSEPGRDPLVALLLQAGRFGLRSGAGWYDYKAGRHDPMGSASLQVQFKAWRQAQGLRERDISESEIQSRILGAWLQEGTAMIQSGVLRQPTDLDVIMLAGYGFPRWRGGVLHQVDQDGLAGWLMNLRQWAARDTHSAQWQASAWLLERFHAGLTIAELSHDGDKA